MFPFPSGALQRDELLPQISMQFDLWNNLSLIPKASRPTAQLSSHPPLTRSATSSEVRGSRIKNPTYFPGLPTDCSIHYQDKLTVTSKSKILAMVTSRSSSAKRRRWSCHCPQGRGERIGCTQLPCHPKRAIRHLRSPAVEVWGTKVRTTSTRILRTCCFIPLSHSWSISACPIPGKCSSSATSASSAPVQHRLHHFCWQRRLLLDVLPAFAFSCHQHDTETCWTSGPVFPFPQNCCLFPIFSALMIPAQVSCHALVSKLFFFFFSTNHFCDLLNSFEFSSCCSIYSQPFLTWCRL